MSQCPKCGHGIEADFGIITCPGCGATLMVAIDGSLVQNEDQPTSEQPNVEADDQPAGFESSSEESVNFGPPENTWDQPDTGDFANNEQAYAGGESEETHGQPETPLFAPTPEPVDEFAPSDLSPAVEDNPSNESPEDVFHENELEDASLPAEVFMVANDKPALSYTVYIEEIDTAALRAEVLRALQLPVLGLENVPQSEHIKGGRLTLTGLTAAQARFLVDQIQEFKLLIRWDHELYAET